MFQLLKTDQDEPATYWYTVTVAMVTEEGRRRNFEFDAQFVRLPQSELEDIIQRVRDGIESNRPIKDREILDRVFVGWRKVAGVGGGDLAVTPDNRERLLEQHPAQPSIVRAWLKSVGIEGAAKN